MTIYIDWKEWREGEIPAVKHGQTVTVCLIRVFPGVGQSFPHIVANCRNLTGKAKDWECRLGRSHKWQNLARVWDFSTDIRRELFVPKTDFLYYTEEELIRLPPSPFEGNKNQEFVTTISELFYYPGDRADRLIKHISEAE